MESTSMPQQSADAESTLALSTKLEEQFVSPLTAVKGALEILRDFPDLTAQERQRFLATALAECERLSRGIEELAATVYAAGKQARERPPGAVSQEDFDRYIQRIHMDEDLEVIEVDLSDFEFSSSKVVNDFYDVLDQRIEATGRRWFLVVNYRNCSIWPEAWVAIAHRGKKVNVSYSMGTVRYVEGEEAGADSGTYPSRDAALAHLAELRRRTPPHARRPVRRG
jgi:hypothetical protein